MSNSEPAVLVFQNYPNDSNDALLRTLAMEREFRQQQAVEARMHQHVVDEAYERQLTEVAKMRTCTLDDSVLTTPAEDTPATPEQSNFSGGGATGSFDTPSSPSSEF